MIYRIVSLMLAAVAVIGFAQTRKPTPPQSLRLYVLDCGKITVANGDSMGFKPGELATSNMVTPCFLIVHPRGTMMWDTGRAQLWIQHDYTAGIKRKMAPEFYE